MKSRFIKQSAKRFCYNAELQKWTKPKMYFINVKTKVTLV